MALFQIKNSLICCHTEEIMANFNVKNKTAYILQTFNLQSFTDLRDLLNLMNVWTSDHYRLTFKCIKNDEEEPQCALQEIDNYELHFIVKRRPEVTRDDARMIAFHKENNLYCVLLPKMLDYTDKVWCPLLYLCRRHLLVIRDLTDLGYSVHDKETFNHSEMLNVLESLAMMHGASLAFEHYNECSIKDTCSYCIEEFLIGRELPWFAAGIGAIVEIAKMHPQYTEMWEKDFIETELSGHLNRISAWLNPSTRYRNVLCHGSPWVGNVFLNKRNPQAPAVLADFQNYHYSPPAMDIVFSLYVNLNEGDRQEKEEIYLKHYYNALIQCLSRNDLSDVTVGMSEDQFRQSYKEFQLFGLTYRALISTILKVTPDYINDHYKYEDRATGVLDYMKKDESFRLLMFDNVKQIIDAVMFAEPTE